MPTPAAANPPQAGVVTRVLKKVVYLHKHQYLEGTNLPLFAGDVLKVSSAGRVRFSVRDGARLLDCTLLSNALPGEVQVRPQTSVAASFRGGTSVCNTPLVQVWISSGGSAFRSWM